MSFRLAARITATICVILLVILGLFPASYAPTYGVAADAGAQFITRRASPMFAGLAVVLWFASHAPRSPLRDGVAFGVALTFAGIAVTGVLAFVSGVASPAILIAALGEVVLAAALIATRNR